jgi:hypothetical protein
MLLLVRPGGPASHVLPVSSFVALLDLFGRRLGWSHHVVAVIHAEGLATHRDRLVAALESALLDLLVFCGLLLFLLPALLVFLGESLTQLTAGLTIRPVLRLLRLGRFLGKQDGLDAEQIPLQQRQPEFLVGGHGTPPADW